MSIAKLKGASQMVANMLKRDKLPARTEAAEELLVVVADVESALTRERNNTVTQARKLDELSEQNAALATLLEKMTKHWEEEIEAFSQVGSSDPKLVADIKASRSLLKKVLK